MYIYDTYIYIYIYDTYIYIYKNIYVYIYVYVCTNEQYGQIHLALYW